MEDHPTAAPGQLDRAASTGSSQQQQHKRRRRSEAEHLQPYSWDKLKEREPVNMAQFLPSQPTRPRRASRCAGASGRALPRRGKPGPAPTPPAMLPPLLLPCRYHASPSQEQQQDETPEGAAAASFRQRPTGSSTGR